MTHPETLESLAARIEALDGPDRDVDYEVAFAFGWEFRCATHWGYRSPHWWLGGKTGAELGLVSHVQGECPHFTKSIDAAMTLVPDDWSMSLHFGPWIAGNVQAINPVTAEEFRIDAATPALAICAAAMRAKAVSA